MMEMMIGNMGQVGSRDRQKPQSEPPVLHSPQASSKFS